MLLIGDSLAGKLTPMLISAEEHDFDLWASTALGCPWQLSIDGYAQFAEDCRTTKADTVERVIPTLLPDVILATSATRDDPTRPVDMSPLDSLLAGISQAELFATSTSEALDTIGSIATNATLVLIEPIPVPPFEPLDCASRASLTADCTFLAYSDPIPSQIVYRYEASLRPNVENLTSTNGSSELPRVRAARRWNSIRRPDPHQLRFAWPLPRLATTRNLRPAHRQTLSGQDRRPTVPGHRHRPPSRSRPSRASVGPPTSTIRPDASPSHRSGFGCCSDSSTVRATDTILDGSTHNLIGCSDRDWPLRVLAHRETRNAEHGRFLLHATRVGQDEPGTGLEGDEIEIAGRFCKRD